MTSRFTPIARVVAAAALIVAVLAGAVGISIWRYENAISLKDAALDARLHQTAIENAATAFWSERKAMTEYLAERRPDASATGDGGADRVRRSAARREARCARRAGAARRGDQGERTRSRRSSSSQKSAAATRPSLENVAIAVLNGLELPVTAPLAKLRVLHATEVTSRLASASSAARQALIASLVAGIAAILAGVGFVVFALRLVARLTHREEALRDLLGQVRETARTLTGASAGDARRRAGGGGGDDGAVVGGCGDVGDDR